MSVFVTKLRSVSSHPPSRCTIPCGGLPYIWEDYREGNNRVVENELDELLETTCQSQSQLELWAAEVDTLRERASYGVLQVRHPRDYPEIKPIRADPTLFELRWNFDGNHLRLYHAEPTNYAMLLLGLLYHWKSLDGTPDEITAAQEAKINQAVKRLENWHAVDKTS